MSNIKSAEDYQALIDSGVSVFGCVGKEPVVRTWSPFTKSFATPREIQSFCKAGATGIAAVCGQVSGNLICIDFDTKNHPEGGKIVDDCCMALIDIVGEDLYRMVRVKTPSGGTHLWFRTEETNDDYRNAKLASRFATKEELQINPKVPKLTFIEMRGQGGYAMVPPSPNYVFEYGSSENIPVFKNEIADEILSVCRSFNEAYEEPSAPTRVERKAFDDYKQSPIDAYNLDESNPWRIVVEDEGWTFVEQKRGRIFYRRPGSENKQSANWHIEKRLFYVFTGNTCFESEKAYTPFNILKIVKFGGDFIQAISYIKMNGYGEQYDSSEKADIKKISLLLSPDTMFEDIIKGFPTIAALPKETRDHIKEGLSEKQYAKNKLYFSLFRQKNGSCKVDISISKFREFLMNTYPRFGKFWRVSKNIEGDYLLIHADRKIVEKLPNGYEDIAHLLVQWIDDHLSELIDEPGDAWSTILKEQHERTPAGLKKSLFSEMQRKDQKDIEYIKDDKHSAYICFKDDVITVNKDGYSSSKYCNGEKYLTKSEILDKEFSRPIEGKIGDFQKFIYNISGITSDCHDKGLLQIYADQGQTNWLKVGPLVLVYGYLMHTYKDPSKPYAIVVSEDVDDSEKGGGTGKSLAMKAPGHLKKLQEIDGKGFKTNNQFAWSLLDEFTKIGLVNDAPDTFDFSALYNYLSDGFEIEKKGVDRKFIPFESSPKICITTNYSLGDAKSEHQSRRIKTILIRRYYTREFTPEQEFGKTFFYDWNNEEWNAFYDFMLTCLSIYFRCGRNVPNQSGGSNSVKKKIRAEMAPYGDDFISYCESSIFKKIWNVNRKEDEFSPIIQPRTEYTDFKDNAGIFDSRDLNAKVFKDNLIKYINGVIKLKQTTKKKNNKGEEEEDGEYDFIKAPLSLKLNKKAWPLFQKWASDQPWFIPEEADVPF